MGKCKSTVYLKVRLIISFFHFVRKLAFCCRCSYKKFRTREKLRSQVGDFSLHLSSAKGDYGFNFEAEIIFFKPQNYHSGRCTGRLAWTIWVEFSDFWYPFTRGLKIVQPNIDRYARRESASRTRWVPFVSTSRVFQLSPPPAWVENPG